MEWGLISGILGLVIAFSAAAFEYFKFRQKRRIKSEIVTWEELEKAGRHLFNQMWQNRNPFLPDLIVGVGRGGAVAAGLIATLFQERQLHTQIAFIDRIYLPDFQTRKTTRIVGFHNANFYKKRVLVINADTFSGGTLNLAAEWLRSDFPKEIKKASLVVYGVGNDGPKFLPDYVGQILPLEQRKRRLPWRSDAHLQHSEKPPMLEDRILVVLHGHVATGKTSTVEALLRENTGDYIPISSDAYWFKHGTRERDREPSQNLDHNEFMIRLCWSILGSGSNAILDSTTRSKSHRNKIVEEFGDWGVTVIFIRCQCSVKCSLNRIQKRLFIGKTDFGDEEQFTRISNEFSPIEEEEQSIINLLDVNTELYACEIKNSLNVNAKKIMEKIKSEIRENYFQDRVKRLGPS